MRRKKRNGKSTANQRVALRFPHLPARLLKIGGISLGLGALLVSGVFGVTALDRYVGTEAEKRFSPRVELENFPQELENVARSEIQQIADSCVDSSWIQVDIPQKMYDSLMATGWFSAIESVRREADARFRVRGSYRLPVARVRQGSSFVLVDSLGFRIPGTWWSGNGWKEIRGVGKPAPAAGQSWEGADLQSGLEMMRILASEAFQDQVIGVDVENIGGRKDKWASHVVLLTNQDDGRIRWGSAPGSEMEENTVAQKIGLLREIYRHTGRIDAFEPVIDISTRSDRFTLPGKVKLTRSP